MQPLVALELGWTIRPHCWGILEAQAHRLSSFGSQPLIKLASWHDSIFQDFLKMATHTPQYLGIKFIRPTKHSPVTVLDGGDEICKLSPPVFPYHSSLSFSSSFLVGKNKKQKRSHHRPEWL